MTADEREHLKTELLDTDPEFRRLHDEHQEYEQRLDHLRAKSLLSQEDEAEEKKIKLHKLALKDQMEQKLQTAGHPAAATA